MDSAAPTLMTMLGGDSVRVERLLARRQVTELWLARRRDGRPCVVKRVASKYAHDRGARRLIEREWEYLGRAQSTGAVAAFGLVDMGPRIALVLEYLPGGDLVSVTGSDPRHWAQYLVEVACTLDALHARGLVHRDVKPRNVLLDAAGRARLIDFASAARVGEHCPSGAVTSVYRDPRAQGIDVATPSEDWYAFAAMTFELLNGRPPIGAHGDYANGSEASAGAGQAHSANQDPALGALIDVMLDVLNGSHAEAGLESFRAPLGAIMTDRRA